MESLDKTREFERGAIQELLENGVYLMDTAYEIAVNLRADAESLLAIYNRIPAEAKYPELKASIEGLKNITGSDQLEEFLNMKERLTIGLNRLLNDLPLYDTQLSGKIEEAVTMTRNCTQMVEAIRALIPLGMNGEYDALAMALRKCEEKVEKLGGDLLENIKALSEALKGIDIYSNIYSRDPVNLSTGNFIYDKEDISLKGRYPLSFKRFYNAINERSGSLGTDWNHNYEIFIEENKERNKITVILANGREDIYRKAEDGTYIPFWFCGSYLEKTGEGYLYTTQEQRRYVFDSEGRHTRQEDPNGNGVTIFYEDVPSQDSKKAAEGSEGNGSGPSRRISKVAEDTGNTLIFTYNKQGQLETVTDQTGRSICFTYEEEHLHTVTGLLGGITAYTYGKNGKIESVINPRAIASVVNQYDHQGRTVKQTFPDGGQMEYEYLDKERTVILTEQNGNRIHYLHDDLKRHIKTIYTDESDKPISEEVFEYNSKNRKTNRTDRNGNRTRLKYDNRGNVTEVIDPLRQRTFLTYNARNRLHQIKKADGSIFKYVYDAKGNLIRSTDPLGHIQEIRYGNGLPIMICLPDGSKNCLSYDTRGNIHTLTDAAGGMIQYEYDALNRVIKSVSPNGHAFYFTYNQNEDIESITNAEGNVRKYEYDASGKVTRVIDYDGGATTYRYNAVGKLEEVTDPSGRTVKFAYDLMWNLISAIDPLGNEFCCEYDRQNYLAKVIDQEGNETSYEHDANGNLTAVISPLGARTEIDYDALNRRQEIREADGAVTRFSYDSVSHLTAIIDPQKSETKITYTLLGQAETVTDPLGNTTSYTYNALGQIQTVTDTLGRTLTYSYYPGGKLKSVAHPGGESKHYTYDRNGNVTEVTDHTGNSTKLSYDCMDRVEIITNPLGHQKRFCYDALGNILSVTDENQNITTYTYSPAGEIIQVTDALGHSTRYGYDGAGRLSRMEQYRLYDDTYADIKEAEAQVTVWEYNRRGEVTRTVSPLGETASFQYDAAGNLIVKTDESGLETLYEYNLANMLSKVLYADGRTVELSYSPLRQLKKMRDWLGDTVVERDALGHVKKVTDHEGKSVQYEWDALSRREGIIYPDGSRVDYRYHTSGQLAEVLSEAGNTQYHYDRMGRLRERVMPEGTVTQYVQDPLGRITGLTHQKNGEILDSFRYTYDPVGNITQIDKYRTGAEADSGSFCYTYDPLDRLTEASGTQGSRQYCYDSLGNRVRSRQGGAETTYSYNARNQLIRSQTGEALTEYGYDPRGNLTQVLENGMVAKSYTYDATNRMTEAATADGSRAEYVYNGFLKRVKRLEEMKSLQSGIQPDTIGGVQDPTCEMRYILDLTKPYNDLLATEGQEDQRFIWSGELLMAEGETSFCYLTDHLGSPIRLLGSGQEEVLAFDEFGAATVEAGADTALHNPFGFTGYQFDDISGSYYAQSRHYDPVTARMLSEDRFRGFPATPQTLNRYCYCLNNPIIYVDANGNFPSLADIVRAGNDLFNQGMDFLSDFVSYTGLDQVLPEIIHDGERLFNKGLEYFSSVVRLSGIDKDFSINTADIGAFFLMMDKDQSGVYHANIDCWQQYFGYNNYYDIIFDMATSMESDRFDFTVSGQDYTLWAWKGDYINLGAGAELGIYKRWVIDGNKTDHWLVDQSLALPMTLILKDKDGKVIIDYAPGDKQWWITGFNPDYKDNIIASELTAVYTVYFYDNKDMLFEFYKEWYGKDPRLEFNLDECSVIIEF